MPQAEITREEIIVVKSGQLNTDGYLEVIDEAGSTHKISPKREQLFPLFEPGKAVALKYASYKNREYVADAEQVEGVFKQEAAKKVQEKMGDNKNRAFALSYAKDWCIAKAQLGKELTYADVVMVATVFEAYLNTGATVTKKES